MPTVEPVVHPAVSTTTDFEDLCQRIEVADNWTNHKRYSKQIAHAVYNEAQRGFPRKPHHIDYKDEKRLINWVARMHDCANLVSMGLDASGNQSNARANLCRVRMCPICGWRKSLERSSQVEAAAQQLRGMVPLHMVLTVKNCKLANLRTTCQQLLSGWSRLRKRKAFQDATNSWIRGLEVSPGHDRGSDCHPHIHAIIWVRRDYFKSNAYLSQERIQRMWRQACRLNYDPVVWIERIRDQRGNMGAIREVCKYLTKPPTPNQARDTGLTVNRWCAWCGYVALETHQLRAFATGGQIAKILSNQQQFPEADQQQDQEPEIARVWYRWSHRVNQYCITAIYKSPGPHDEDERWRTVAKGKLKAPPEHSDVHIPAALKFPELNFQPRAI